MDAAAEGPLSSCLGGSLSRPGTYTSPGVLHGGDLACRLRELSITHAVISTRDLCHVFGNLGQNRFKFHQEFERRA